MEMVYLFCALVGGTVMICQFVMTVVGMGGDGDGLDDVGADVELEVEASGEYDAAGDDAHGHHHADPTWLFGLITFRTVVAALAFFGLAGLAAKAGGLTAAFSFLIALASGAVAMYAVHWLMQLLHSLKEDGTVRIGRAIGKMATVYLTIPAEKAGAGKVHMNLQNRTMEYQAVTSRERLPTGSRVIVIDVIGADTVEVAPAPDLELGR